MQCNIDAKGKALRLISGIIFVAIALTLLLLRALSVLDGSWPWITGIVMLSFGAFQIFEARAGWCIVRAMGFKTRI